MKKLFLAILILSNSMQTSCSNENVSTSNKLPTSQELTFEKLKPKIIGVINKGTGLKELTKIMIDMIKNIENEVNFNYLELFSDFINHENENGYTFLTQAIKNKNIPTIQRLITLCVDVDQQDCFGNTPLHDAIFSNVDKQVIELLIAAGANATITNKSGKTARGVRKSERVHAMFDQAVREREEKFPSTKIKTSLRDFLNYQKVRKVKLDIVVQSDNEQDDYSDASLDSADLDIMDNNCCSIS